MAQAKQCEFVIVAADCIIRMNCGKSVGSTSILWEIQEIYIVFLVGVKIHVGRVNIEKSIINK